MLENDEDKYVLAAPLRRGNIKLQIDKLVVHDGDVRPGMLRLMVPGERNRVTTHAPAEVMFLSIPGPLFRQITSDTAFKGGSARPAFVHPLFEVNLQVANLSTALTSVLEVDARQRQLFIDGLTHSLLALLLSAQTPATGTNDLARKSGLTDAQLAQCLDYADSRLSERLDLDSWAATIGMPTSEFARRFLQKTHLPPYAWFMNWRIDRAKQLLSRSDLSVVEIAMEVGFCSQSHFTEAFRRRVGLSPGRWRSQTLGRDLDSQRNHESHF